MSSPAQEAPRCPTLRIDVRREAAASVVEISGELDIATAPAVKKAFDSLFVEGDRHLIIDLAGLEFMDMSGIHLLEEFGNRLTEDHGQLELRRPTRTVGRLLAILDRIAGGHPRPWVCHDPTDATGDP